VGSTAAVASSRVGGSRGEKRNVRAGDPGDGVHGLEDSDALISADHRVAGFARSDESAWKLKERGIQAVEGNTADAGSLREAARGADAVAQAALIPDEGAEEAECTVVGAVVDVLWDTGRTTAHNSGGGSRGTRRRA
jgi:hypothetical protein